jgi:hypothetical protein
VTAALDSGIEDTWLTSLQQDLLRGALHGKAPLSA